MHPALYHVYMTLVASLSSVILLRRGEYSHFIVRVISERRDHAVAGAASESVLLATLSRALGRLALQESNMSAIVNNGGVTAIVNTLMTNPDAESIQVASSTRALINMAKYSERCATLAAAGAVEAVL